MMLVLSRKEGERIVVGRDILITVIESRGNRVRLGITAPQGISINRQEVSERLAHEEAADSHYEGYRDGAPFSV
jgi:carbon storage regulator